MAEGIDDPGEGFRRRSLSESDTERISDLPLTPRISDPGRSSFATEIPLTHHHSVPNIRSPENGSFLESPAFRGIGTRLQARVNPNDNDRQIKVINDAARIKKEVESWIVSTKSDPPPSLDSIFENYQLYKRRVQRVNEEALVRRLDMSITFGLAELQLKLEGIRKLAIRRERKELNLDEPPSSHRLLSIDEVFAQETVATEILSSAIPGSDPYDHFSVDDSPSQSLPNPILPLSTPEHHSRTDSPDSPTPPPCSNPETSRNPETPPPPWLDNILKDRDSLLIRMNRLEVNDNQRSKELELMRTELGEVSEKLGLAFTNTLDNNDKIENLRESIDRIDRAVKKYIDIKLNEVKSWLDQVNVLDEKGELAAKITQDIKNALGSDNPNLTFKEIRDEINALKVRNRCEEITIANIRDLAIQVKDKLEQSHAESINISSMNINPRVSNTNRDEQLIQHHLSNPVSNITSVSNQTRLGVQNPSYLNLSRVNSITDSQTQDSNLDNSLSTTFNPLDRRNKERDLIRDAIESSSKLIHQLISVKISNTSDVSLIRKCNLDIKKVTGYSKSCHDLLMRYVTYEGIDTVYYDSTKTLLESANNWVLQVENVYSTSEAHALGGFKGDLSGVGIFSNNANKSIFEFFEDLELGLTGWGTGKQRATQLFNNHLSENIKSQTQDISHSYSNLRSWLYKKYGSPDTIVNDIISGLTSKRKLNPTTRKEKYDFYSEITRSLARLDKLIRVPEINVDDLETMLYSQQTLRSLFSSIPEDDIDQFKRNITARRLDWINPSGIRTFVAFKELCEDERNILESPKSNLMDSAKPKQKSVFATGRDHDSGLNEERGVHNLSRNPPPKWYPSGLSFPCPLENHKHEMAECLEFFSMSPENRWDGIAKRRICYSCLRPKDVCKDRNCSFVSTVPEVLTCQGCAPRALSKGWSTLSIIMCRTKEHAATRAPLPEIKKSFEKYLGKLTPAINENNIKISVNFMQQVYAIIPNPENPSILNSDTPVINTRTGERVKMNPSHIIPEIPEHSSYLMQTLKIGQQDSLVFFDTGANTNLILGELAVTESLQLISSRSSSLTVVGGSSIKTEYGSYRLALGPDTSGEFYEVKCQGMDQVTSKFKRYDLSEIVAEFRQCADTKIKHEILPPYVAGSEVHLLLGIKNTYLNPVLLGILPSGVGVYRSPFVDIFGSRIIFAGPHSSFTSHNGGLKDDISHAIFHAKEAAQRKPWLEKEIPYSLLVDKTFNIDINPTPVTEKDILDTGGQIMDYTGEGEYTKNQDQSVFHYCSAHKVGIPIAKMRELMNLDNPDDIVSYRCKDCAKCITCKRSPRLTAISIQESLEQSYIENSIKIDLTKGKVIANLPFMRDPVEFMSKKHAGNNNYRQARNVYLSQCKKSTIEKEGMIKAHKELVDKGFMIKLTDLKPQTQQAIKTAPFNHYYPWFIVRKDDSISTPIRLVVDPSMSGLNLILPKGENRLGQILDIVIRNRVVRHIFSSDVSKLYNQLELNEDAYPYSLFLYHESLDPGKEPEVYVMLRAWYGVISTGNQAGYALDQLAEIGKEEFTAAKPCLDRDRYVDDIMAGHNTLEGRENQINQVQELLSRAGFSLKYIVKSGEPPSEKASTDGKSVKLLGYKWSTVSDIINPGIGEFNINKKYRGTKKDNPSPIITREDAQDLLETVNLTRRIIISKIAEVFDPLGLWEPIKVQYKLKATGLNSFPWDKPLNQILQDTWKTTLSKFVDLSELSARRYPFPDNCDHEGDIRLVCFSDAGKDAGGAAIYVGKRTPENTWSCALLCARSKLLKGTIPRNELSAILLMAELAYVAKKSLGNQVKEIVYLTDSTIALSWIHNTSIKLRSYIHSRAEASRRLIQMTVNSECIPLFHIDGNSNLADLLTKPHVIETDNVSIGSEWEQGLDWMKQESVSFPTLKYEDLKVDRNILNEIKNECFNEPLYPESLQTHGVIRDHKTTFMVAPGRKNHTIILDPISFGWNRTLRIISAILAFPQALIHRVSHTAEPNPSCRLCIVLKEPDYRDNFKLAKDVLYRYESNVIKDSLSPKLISKYKEWEGILYFVGRFSKDNPFSCQNLDGVQFLDKHEFSGPVPVILVDSPILYSLIMHIHNRKLPHAGVEITVKEIFKEIMVPGGVRRMIRRIKSECSTCRILERKTVEIEMSEHPKSRTIIAPPFFTCMGDIAFGFKGKTFKRSRTSLKFYALVLVCIATGATNVLLLEGLQTQDVVQALERHASRHGIPSDIFIDNGTQLLALKHVEFSIRDIDTQVYDSMGFRVHESSAKSHIERGRVERKIRSVKDMIERLGIQSTNPMTSIQWETLFAKVASNINDLPIARGDSSSVSNVGFEILTPNRLLLGRNNFRSLEGNGLNIESTKIPTQILDRNREVYKTWYTLFMENIHMLQVRPDKWCTNSRLPCTNDVVLFVLNDSEYSKNGATWKLGKVLSCEARKVTVSYVSKISKTGIPTLSTLNRGIRDISIIFSIDELFVNTSEHYESLFFTLFEE